MLVLCYCVLMKNRKEEMGDIPGFWLTAMSKKTLADLVMVNRKV